MRNFVQRAAILIFNGNLRVNPETKDAGPEKNLDMSAKDATTKRFSLGEGASGDNARLRDVDALARGSFKISQQRADGEQGGEAIAADGPVVRESRTAYDPGVARSCWRCGSTMRKNR